MAVKGAKELNNECEMYKDKYYELSDEELLKRYRFSQKY